MPDIASLIVKLDATQVETGAASLDKLTAAGDRAEDAVVGLGNAAKTQLGGLSAIPAALQSIDVRTAALRGSVDPLANAMAGANSELAEASSLYRMGALGAAEYARYVGVLEARIETATSAQNAMNLAQQRGARAAGLTSSEMVNLGRQFSDIGVSAAMGMSPLMILVQQGPQIGDTLAMASTRGVGLSAALRSIAVSGWAALAPLLPFIAAVGAVAAVVGGGLAMMNREMKKADESSAQLQKRLGLTDEQMKKVGSTSITMGDTIGGVWDLVAKGADVIVGPAIDRMRAKFTEWYDSATAGAARAVKWIVGGWIGGFDAIKAVWAVLPAAIGDVAISAANRVLQATGKMVNLTIDSVNAMLNVAKIAAQVLGQTLDIKPLANLLIPSLSAGLDGAATTAGERAATAFATGMAKGSDLVDKAWQMLGDATSDRRDARLLKEAGDPKKAAAKSGRSDTQTAYEQAVKAAQGYIAALKEEAETFGMNAIARKQYDIAQAASLAPTQALSAAIREQGAALIALMAPGGKITDKAGGDWKNFNDELARTAELLAQLDDHARDAASGFVAAFDGVSRSMAGVAKGIGGLLSAYTGLARKEAEIAAVRRDQQRGFQKGSAEWMQAEVLASREGAHARIEAYSGMATAAKGFFEEGSDGYKAMQAAEIAFRTVEMLMTIKSMALNTAKSASDVAAAGTSASAWGVAAFAKTLASLPFPFNLAAGAVVLAALAGVGVMISGGGGGSAPGSTDMQTRQDAQGAGSVLGDTKAKSESIARALDLVAANSNKDLEYSNGMLKALRSIDDQIGVVAAALARSFGAGGMLDTSKLNLGTSASGPSGLMKLINPLAAILPGLFGSTKTRTLQDQGVQFNGGTLESILGGGLSGNSFQQVLENTKKKFLGITYSDKSKTSTTTGALDADFLRQTTLLIGSLRDGVVAAASVLGVEGAAATLAAFTLNLGKLSFKDMKGDEIQAALEAVFGKAADDMAGAVLPGLADFQKVGEGLFETLTRVARQYQVVDVSLASIGKVFGAVGVSSLAARERLVDLFGGIDAFAEQTAFYAETFLTEAERLAPVQSAVTAEMARLGLAAVDTRDEFKAVVQGLDFSTAAGASLYAALMAVAPAFAKITEESKAVADARSVLSTAYERESGALQSTLDRFKGFASGLKAYGAGLYNGPSAALSPEAQYQATRGEFSRVAALAAAGNEGALGDLQSVSQAYLDASKAYYASSTGYFDDLAAVRAAVTAAEGSATAQVDVAQAQLDAMTAQVGQLIDLNTNVVSVADAILALNALLMPTAPNLPTQTTAPSDQASNDNTTAIVAELQASNATLTELVATQQAGLDQQAAIFAATSAKQQEQIDALARIARDLQASA